MKYIASCSGGKDSIAMVLHLIKNNKPLDEVIFCDTGVEYPEIYQNIRNLERFVSTFNIPFTRLKNDFIDLMLNHKYTKKCWPMFNFRWCTDLIKVKPQKRYLDNKKEIFR